MTLLETQKLSKHLCRLLKVTDITFPIGRTSKGNFGIVFNENGEWEMMLDSIPLSTKNVLTDENNIELKAMVEKYWLEKEKEAGITFYPPSVMGLEGIKDIPIDNTITSVTVGKIFHGNKDVTDEYFTEKHPEVVSFNAFENIHLNVPIGFEPKAVDLNIPVSPAKEKTHGNSKATKSI